jgi:multiple sugar transport system ATP-binding protein
MARLEIDRVGKSYRRQPVLAEVSLSVAAGEAAAICGPSGGGKTVLLRLVAGIIDPDAGDIRIDGRSVLGAAPQERDVGMAFQNFALYPHLSAFYNIASPLQALRLGRSEVQRRVEEIAALLRIDHVLAHMPRELSNGQKQRTALARSLVRGPAVLLLDDPLRNVDAKLRYEMRLELPRLLKTFGSAVLYVTQDYREAMALGDRVGVLRAGRFEQVAPSATIYTLPQSVEVARLFGDPTINLYPCRPRVEGAGMVADLFGRPLALPPGAETAAARDCLLGIRPEHVRVHLEPTASAMSVELEAVTPLNVRAVLYLRASGGEEMLATLSEDEATRFGRERRRIWIDIAPESCLLFDRASGARIAPMAS